jgi:hypothetical protein
LYTQRLGEAFSRDFGYQRSRWSTELLAIKINEITGCQFMQEPFAAGCHLRACMAQGRANSAYP